MKKLLTIFFICLFFGLQSQDTTNPKALRFGMNVSLPWGDVGKIPIGPILSYKWKKHEVSAGLDYYRFAFRMKYAVVGIQSTYNYYISKHIFAGFHLQYYQFGSGKANFTRYDFPFGTPDHFNISRYQLFFNTITLGYTRTLFKRIHWLLIGGGGYNYLTEENSFGHSNVGFSGPGKHHKIIPAWHFKFGISTELWNNNPRKPKQKKEKPEEIPWD